MNKRELQMLREYLTETKDINETIKKNTESAYNIIMMYTILETIKKEIVKITVLYDDFRTYRKKIYFSGIMVNEEKFKFPLIGPIDYNELFCMIARDGFEVYKDFHEINFVSNKSMLEKVLEFNNGKQKQKN